MFKTLSDWYLAKLDSYGYPLIALLMAMESSIIPLPSEFVIPPAAHWAHTHSTSLTVWGVIIAGTIGSWLGASAMYWVARIAGRPLIIRYGRLALITPEKVAGAERWAEYYGAGGIFISRLLPVVRHLIGIPAGVVRMNFKLYSLFTLLGSGIWCAVLCYIGIKMGEDQKLMKGELHRVSLWVGGSVIALGAMYFLLVHRHMKHKPPTGPGTSSDQKNSRRAN